MNDKKKIIAYFDGSNFYHNLKKNYGITNINFYDFTNNIIRPNEVIIKIKYYNCPVSQQENPQIYKEQQKFFAKLRSNPNIEVYLGKLVKRGLKEIHINCPTCGHQLVDSVNCPRCKQEVFLKDCFRSTEKGVDVNLAISMLLDALDNNYNFALLFSGDADFCPAIKYIQNILKKEVVYCYFPGPITNELLLTCFGSRKITEEMVKKAQLP